MSFELLRCRWLAQSRKRRIDRITQRGGVSAATKGFLRLRVVQQSLARKPQAATSPAGPLTLAKLLTTNVGLERHDHRIDRISGRTRSHIRTCRVSDHADERASLMVLFSHQQGP